MVQKLQRIGRTIFLLSMIPLLLSIFMLAVLPLSAQKATFTLRGEIIDEGSRLPIPYATAVLADDPTKGSVADSLGRFVIKDVPPGIYRLQSSSLGYEPRLTQEYIVSLSTPPITIALRSDTTALESVVVTSTLFSRIAQSSISNHRIGLQQIENTPGSNRDISRIVQSFPGVSFSPIGYRNDLIVRGGSPSENAFFLDGFQIPNINHFSTQGAGGGPVSLVNADLIREVEFYTGAFPANQGGALSSMLDVELRDGNREEQRFKAVVGASEVGVSGSGHFTDKCNYIFSARQSYLQFLFQLLGLPLLPNYIDLLGKVEYNPTVRDEITFLGLCAFDDMTINMENNSTFTEYIAGYIPHIRQQSYTGGVKWRRYLQQGQLTLIASHSTLANLYKKYEGNDESDPSKMVYNLKSTESKSYISGGWRGEIGRFRVGYGAELNYEVYDMDSFQRFFTGGEQSDVAYRSWLGMFGWAGYGDFEYRALSNRLTLSGGVRFDGVDYNRETAEFWHQLSPRVGIEYELPHQITLKSSAGIYYQLPPLTALGYKEDGEAVNSQLSYMNVKSTSLGAQWQYRNFLILSLEGFYKGYSNIPLSVEDGISLSDKGNDYGIVGNEELVSSASARSYGAEMMVRWARANKFSVVGSFTLYRSESRTSPEASFAPSAWDNRFIINISGTYNLPKDWSIGAKVSAIGGAPFTPYDEELSSYVAAWDIKGQPYYDYSQHNTLRLENYAQLDIRVDKNFYFRHWSLGLYLDIQNITYSTLVRPDLYISTGVVANPWAMDELQRYYMAYLEDKNGAVIPTLGITVEF